MKYVRPKDKEKINEVARELDGLGKLTWDRLAQKTGWSATTVRKYYDKDWYPGKYFQKPMKKTAIPEGLEHPGVYLLAYQSVVDGKIVNLVKVGQSKNLKKRLSSYQGMNPFVKCIDTKFIPEEDLDAEEKFYHMVLGMKNVQYGGTEWFICSDEEYNYWINRKL
jgi:hypothetical protein